MTSMATASERTDSRVATNVARAYTFADLSQYSFKERFLIRAADLAFFAIIKLIGKTIRFEVEGWENWEAAMRDDKLPIYTFWHNQIFVGTYFWQRRGIVILTSQSFDGEYIARFIKRFGYGAVRGSSTRGATGALVEMVRLMRAGCPTGFAVDGPKGPRHEAKLGNLLVAKKTGSPILPFTMTAKNYWELRQSWDLTQIPKPFTRAKVIIGAPILISAKADEAELKTRHDEVQRTLDQLTQLGEKWRANL
jgi:lysophospholipid acyltransferase (LPLAT)-like uncharacterized protein